VGSASASAKIRNSKLRDPRINRAATTGLLSCTLYTHIAS